MERPTGTCIVCKRLKIFLTLAVQVNEAAAAGEPGHTVYWVARQRRFFGTLRIRDVGLLSVTQLLFGTSGIHVASFFITWLTRLVFWLYGCIDWLPDAPLDLQKEQLAPDRGHLLTYRHRINRVVSQRWQLRIAYSFLGQASLADLYKSSDPHENVCYATGGRGDLGHQWGLGDVEQWLRDR